MHTKGIPRVSSTSEQRDHTDGILKTPLRKTIPQRLEDIEVL